MYHKIKEFLIGAGLIIVFWFVIIGGYLLLALIAKYTIIPLSDCFSKLLVWLFG